MDFKEIKDLAEKHGAKMIDAKFVDFLGSWKHLTYPIDRLQEGQMEAALALSMTRWTALRRIIIPQAVRLVIPPVTKPKVTMSRAQKVPDPLPG